MQSTSDSSIPMQGEPFYITCMDRREPFALPRSVLSALSEQCMLKMALSWPQCGTLDHPYLLAYPEHVVRPLLYTLVDAATEPVESPLLPAFARLADELGLVSIRDQAKQRMSILTGPVEDTDTLACDAEMMPAVCVDCGKWDLISAERFEAGDGRTKRVMPTYFVLDYATRHMCEGREEERNPIPHVLGRWAVEMYNKLTGGVLYFKRWCDYNYYLALPKELTAPNVLQTKPLS